MLPSRIDKNALWKEHTAKFSCDHSQSELRERTIRGGGKQCVHQCLRCGMAVSNSVKREIALAQNDKKPLTPFDEQLLASWEADVKESADRITNADDSAFWQAYEKYLTSSEWQKKREKVLARASGLCEGCMENSATQAHHLSYEHVGDEYLFELVAVCDDCHEKLHLKPT
jgi:hypothetical protein